MKPLTAHFDAEFLRQIRRDRERTAEQIRRRDEIRGRLNAGLPALGDRCLSDELIAERKTEAKRERGGGDMDTNGDLIEPGRFGITGWRTRDEEEDGWRKLASTPAETGESVANLLRHGFYQIVVDDLREGG